MSTCMYSVGIFIETLGPSRSIIDSVIKQSLKIIISYSINYLILIFYRGNIFIPLKTKLRGVYWNNIVHPSVCRHNFVPL